MLRENSKLNTIELPINRAFSYEKERTLREKTLRHSAKIESHLQSSQEFHCSSKPIPTSSNQSGDSPLT